MVPMNTNDDEWIADVASYVRNSFGNHGGMVHWTDAARACVNVYHQAMSGMNGRH